MDAPVFVILSFEGPDPYSCAGGVATRVDEMSGALAGEGLETHLFFVGDPYLPGHETVAEGNLHLHRWCQWISRHHPGGVYDGEEGKLYDWERSLPPYLESEVLGPLVAAGKQVVVLAEEWQTAGVVAALGDALRQRGWSDGVRLLWNANNTYSFNRIDWRRLRDAAEITTVSRFMKQAMWRFGVDARVVPNGLAPDWLGIPSAPVSSDLSGVLSGRLSLAKVARWHPDKRWLMAVRAVGRLKRLGLRPAFLVRGGSEAHLGEVLSAARDEGLQVAFARPEGRCAEGLLPAVQANLRADMIVLESPLSADQLKVLFQSSSAVLANSGFEPFGLVGLQAMASSGVAFVGCTGEDYATHGHDAICIQTNDAAEIVHELRRLSDDAADGERLRRNARQTAQRYAWPLVIRRTLIPLLDQLGIGFGTREGERVERRTPGLAAAGGA